MKDSVIKWAIRNNDGLYYNGSGFSESIGEAWLFSTSSECLANCNDDESIIPVELTVIGETK